MKFLFAALLAPTLCMGAIWPENIGAWKRAATMQATLVDRPIWDEYGLKESEAARYENGDENFTVTGYRLQDTTGAMAAFDWQRLAKSIPSIPPSVAAFHYGAEGQMGVFHGPKGDMGMVIFSYPTPQIAMLKEMDFRGIPGGNLVKRSGPLVAVVLAPADPDAAERLLSQVKYEASVTLDQWVPSHKDNIGNLVINAFILIGILLGFSIVSGLAFGGWRAFRRRGNRGDEADALTTLHLGR